MLILWQFETCAHSARVRKQLTELSLDFVAINAPPGEDDKDAVMQRLFGSNKTPAMWDTRTSALLQDADAICDYITRRFEGECPPD